MNRSCLQIGLSVAVLTLAVRGIAGVTLTEDDMKRTGEAGRLARVGKPSATTVPSERHKKGSSSHQRIVKAFAAAPEHPIVLFGDSLTDNWRGKRFEYMATNFPVVNAGICADRIEDVLWRLNDMLPAMKAKPPKLVTFMVGANNMGDRYTAEDVCEGQRNLVRIVRENLPAAKIIVFAIPPEAVCHDPHPKPYCAAANRLYRTIADDENVFFFDFSELLVDKHATTLLTDLYTGDRVHFTDKGYAEVITPFIAGAIRLVLSPNRPKDYTRRIGMWREYLEARLRLATRNQSTEERWRNEFFLYDLPRSLMKEFAALEKDPNYVPQLPEECLRQNREEGLPKEFDGLR